MLQQNGFEVELRREGAGYDSDIEEVGGDGEVLSRAGDPRASPERLLLVAQPVSKSTVFDMKGAHSRW